MAIPIAAARGLRVVTSGSVANEGRVRALGASEFIDYREQDYADVLRKVVRGGSKGKTILENL